MLPISKNELERKCSFSEFRQKSSQKCAFRENVLQQRLYSDFIEVSRKYFLPNSEDSCSNVFLWQKLLILPPGKPTHTHIRSFSCCPSPYHIISLFVFFTNILNKLLNLLSWSPPPPPSLILR